MSTNATAPDSTTTSDDYFDASTGTHLPVAETDVEGKADSLTAAEAVAASPSPFDTTATKRLPNTTDGDNQVVR